MSCDYEVRVPLAFHCTEYLEVIHSQPLRLMLDKSLGKQLCHSLKCLHCLRQPSGDAPLQTISLDRLFQWRSKGRLLCVTFSHAQESTYPAPSTQHSLKGWLCYGTAQFWFKECHLGVPCASQYAKQF